ncbi:MAG: flippase-like domain-containing protein [Brumimicrobium sp.]|nr:flippase-like domain-containing protein [Brumimicrobium sp.]
MGKGIKKIVIDVAKIVLPLGVGVYLTWYLFSSMDIATKTIFYDAIKHANYFWIFLALIFALASHVLRAYRWRFMLEPLGVKPNFWHRYHAVMIGYLMNLLIPRAGEASRAAMLYRTDRIPFAKSFGTIIAERVFDVAMTGIIFLFAITVSMEDLLSIKETVIKNSTRVEGETGNGILFIIGGVFLLGLFMLIIFWLKSPTFKEKIIQFVRGMFNGIFSIFKSKHPFQFLFYTLLIWLFYLINFSLCFKAFEQTQDFPLEGILVGFIAGTFGVAFTNGGIGAYPYLVGIVVMYFIGAQYDSKEMVEGIGKALGMIIWSSQTILLIILGIISLIFLPRNYNKEQDEKMG